MRAVAQSVTRAVGRVTSLPFFGQDAEVPPFSPTDIPGLTAWYDAADIDTLFQDSGKTTAVALDGDPIGAVADKSGNGYDMLQATESAKPIYKTGIINSLPTIRGDGINDKLQSLGWTAITGEIEIWLIATNFTTADSDIYFSSGNVSVRVDYYTPSPSSAWINGGDNWIVGGVLPTGDNPQAIRIVYSSTDSLYERNGVTAASGGNTGTNDLDGFTLFSFATGGNASDMDVGEVFVFDGRISEENLSSLESYIADKWGITVG